MYDRDSLRIIHTLPVDNICIERTLLFRLDDMEVLHEEQKKKGVFYIEENGERLAELEYFHSAPGVITAYHTFVNERLRGHKIGDKLVAALVGFVRKNGLKIVATCPFTKKVIERTPDFHDVLA